MTHIQFAELKKLLQPKKYIAAAATLGEADATTKLYDGLPQGAKIASIIVHFTGAVGDGAFNLEGVTVAQSVLDVKTTVVVPAPHGGYFSPLTNILWVGDLHSVAVLYTLE